MLHVVERTANIYIKKNNVACLYFVSFYCSFYCTDYKLHSISIIVVFERNFRIINKCGFKWFSVIRVIKALQVKSNDFNTAPMYSRVSIK